MHCTHSLHSGLRRFLTGPGLPTFLLTLVALYEAFLLAVIFAPEGSGPWGTFALEFKVWCFSYDPRTGGMEWSAVWMMLLEPLFITGIVVVGWRKGLGALLTLRGWFEQRRPALAGVMVATAALGVLYLYGQPSAEAGEPLPFPGERIRTRIEPPPFGVGGLVQACIVDGNRGIVGKAGENLAIIGREPGALRAEDEDHAQKLALDDHGQRDHLLQQQPGFL